jgi:hypothetical protein
MWYRKVKTMRMRSRNACQCEQTQNPNENVYEKTHRNSIRSNQACGASAALQIEIMYNTLIGNNFKHNQ